MSTPANPTIDDLLKRREVTNFDTFAIVSIPGVPSGQIKDEVLKRLRDDPSLTSGQVDPSALYDRLRDLTPPIDEEEDLRECQALERDARIELEQDGCPPCYPPDLDIPLHNVPLECQPITSYWQAEAGRSKVVLCAQLNDWKRFRFNQKRRQNFPAYSQHMASIRERDADVNWAHVDPTLKTQLEDWEEFEYHHSLRHTKLEKEHGEWERERDKAAEHPRYNASMGLTDAEACEKRRQYSVEKVRSHGILLHWIREKKSEMMTRIRKSERSRHIEEIRDLNPGQRRSHRRVAMTRPQTATQKATRRDVQRHVKKAQQVRAIPRRLPKDRHSSNAESQHRRTLYSTETRTRSGRISKPPVRWVPG